jgi:hypothetical protein
LVLTKPAAGRYSAEWPEMFRRIFKRRFKVGDRVKLLRTGQNAEIVDKGTLPVARKDITTFIQV